ncbi:MAG: hypothetical protein Q7S51_01405 [Gallionellaceae bacterium]|nr:hypothetical protein [Gallionellaceae bacterium]
MSPLWRDRIGVELAPHRIAWVRLARGLQPGVVIKGMENVAPQTNAPVWQAALAQLQQLMQSQEWKNADVAIVLSNHFVRYDCLPWNAAVKSEEEQLALARHRLLQVYGTMAQTWAARISPAKKGAARLVAAIDEALLEMLKLATAEAGLKLYSVQPYLMASFNHYAKQLTQSEGWFVAAESGRFALALFRSGSWQHVQLRRGIGMAALHEWLERENLAIGDPTFCREVFLFAPELAKEALLPDYQLHRMELPARHGYSPITDVQYSIALSGVA